MKHITLQGQTDAERIVHAERIINRLARRSQKVTTVATACIPISCIVESIPVSGNILTYFSPIAGTISSMCLEVEWPEFEKAEVDVTVLRHNTQGLHLAIGKGLNVVDTKLSIEKGDKVQFALHSIESKKKGGVDTLPDRLLLGFCIYPATTSMHREQIAIDALEGVSSEIISN